MVWWACVQGDELPACVAVTPAPYFQNQMYEGHWYEVGKIQTPGGASFQEGCWCDVTDFTSPDPGLADGEVTYTCRKDGPQGKVKSASADLIYKGTPGQFKQQFRFPFAPQLDYSIMYIDENTTMEYDCHTNVLGITNYCIHFMSRHPTMSENTLTSLIDYAESLGLNNQNITYKGTKQEGCW
ncbi:uncharacterized protein LOC121874118 isoform X2 [Homarus americanus]|nr:uncharacterized protein LOC121874118 isoform X2 [Homarus americanus]XP_042234006.1 uncharacterized protein LOC121874118 isoform X2 [Homarus americanus]